MNRAVFYVGGTEIMSSELNTRIIDGDGHILEDNPGILEHMEAPYRDIAAKKGIIFPPIDHLHDGRAVETPPLRDGRAKVGPDGWLQFLEDVGIDWTVMYPTQGLGQKLLERRQIPGLLGQMIFQQSYNSGQHPMAVMPSPNAW